MLGCPSRLMVLGQIVLPAFRAVIDDDTTAWPLTEYLKTARLAPIVTLLGMGPFSACAQIGGAYDRRPMDYLIHIGRDVLKYP
jgi:hypothetical protein